MTSDATFEKVRAIITEVLKVDSSVVTNELAIGDIPEWDSVANVKVLQALEDAFSIEIDVLDALDAEDVFDFVSLIKKYLQS